MCKVVLSLNVNESKSFIIGSLFCMWKFISESIGCSSKGSNTSDESFGATNASNIHHHAFMCAVGRLPTSNPVIDGGVWIFKSLLEGIRYTSLGFEIIIKILIIVNKSFSIDVSKVKGHVWLSHAVFESNSWNHVLSFEDIGSECTELLFFTNTGNSPLTTAATGKSSFISSEAIILWFAFSNLCGSHTKEGSKSSKFHYVSIYKL